MGETLSPNSSFFPLGYSPKWKIRILYSVTHLAEEIINNPKGILEDKNVLPDRMKVKVAGMVTYVPYSIVRMDYNWGPDAASLKPERWLKPKGGLFTKCILKEVNSLFSFV